MPDQDSSTRFRAPIIELFSPTTTSARTISRTTMMMIAINMREELTGPPVCRGSNLERVLVLEQAALQLGTAPVVADVAARSDHAVTWHDDRNRVGPERRPRRPERPRAAGALRCVRVGDHLAERHLGGRAQDSAVEARVAQAPVEREIEAIAFALEVLVELSPRLVQALWVGKDARRDVLGEMGENVVQALARQGQPHEPAVGCGHDDIADRGVHRRIGDVQEPLFGCARRQALDEIVHVAISFSSSALLRSFFKPSCTFWRAPSSDVPSASPTSRYRRSAANRRTTAARCPGGSSATSAQIALSRGLMPRRSSAGGALLARSTACSTSAVGSSRFAARWWSIALRWAIVNTHERRLPACPRG